MTAINLNVSGRYFTSGFLSLFLANFFTRIQNIKLLLIFYHTPSENDGQLFNVSV